MSEPFYYGGQAVIEGVMIRGKRAVVTAVLRPGGELVMDIQPLSPLYTGWLRRTPLIRGIIVLIEAMVLGIKSLIYSANVSLEKEKYEFSGKALWGTVIISLAFAIALFLIIPLFLTKLIDPYIQSSLVFHLIEGFIRLVIFVAYLWLVGLVPEIKRIFTYHGAEHKVVNAYEAGVPMEVSAVKAYGTAHVRCGTSFLFVVLVIAILAFALIGRQSLWVMVLSRILLIPAIAATGYEIIHFGARHIRNRLVRALLAPGVWLQELTTREPGEIQIEVALNALQKAMEIDQAEEAT